MGRLKKKEIQETKEIIETKKIIEINETKDTNESKETKEIKKTNETKEIQESNDTNDTNESNDTNDTNDTNESNESNESNDTNESNESNESNELEDGITIKIIKKRGRKPKLKTQTEIELLENIKKEKIEKKENKIKINEIKKENKLNKIKNKTNDDTEDENEENGIMKTKRRGRKPKDKFKYENNDIEDLNHNKKDENIIVKLPLSCLKLTEEFTNGKDLFQYNPTITEPLPYINDTNRNHNHNFEFIINNDKYYNEENENNNNNINNNSIKMIINNNELNNNQINNNEINNNQINNNQINNNQINTYNQQSILNNINNNYSNVNENNSNKEPIRQIDIILNNKYNSNTDKLNVLTHLSLNIKSDKWITTTNSACLWCCHTFTNIPWGIPYQYRKNKFQLFGNFCLPNCALAYILQYYKEDDSFWEKISLLNLLYFKVFGEYKNLTPSIDKMALKLFGGKLDIDEYRNINGLNNKMYNIEFPPCNTIIPILEEIYKKTNLNNTFLPIDKKNQPLLTMNDFKLKRNKPIINPKNTLDFCLKK